MKQVDTIRKILHYFNLDAEIDDFSKIHETIAKDIVFKGTNLWILMFAIIVASIGLNVNSTAVIIGAMLISPLMGPINGLGYSIATYNFPLFRKAIKNFSFAVLTGLVTSTIYFVISPISTAHSELLARTSPTIYDVLIALFGGMAGIVAISSKQKGNVIPGVAIATALMPPLCTAGYGLATDQFNYFFGAFYLFAINTVFIAFSAFVISQLLKLPICAAIGTAQKKKVTRWITVITFAVLIPSVYLGYNLVQQEKFINNAKKYIENVSFVEGNYLLKHEVDAKKKSMTLIYGGSSITEEQKNIIKERALSFALSKAEIHIKQGLAFDTNGMDSEVEKLRAEVNRLTLLLKEKETQINNVRTKEMIGLQLLKEIRELYPTIKTCSYSEAKMFDGQTQDPSSINLVVLTTTGNELTKSDKKKIENWLKSRLDTDHINVYYER